MNFQIPDCLRNSFLSCIKSPRLRIFHPENTEDTSYRLPASEQRTKLVLIWSSVSGSLPLSKLLLPKACRVGSLFLSVSKISLDVYKYVSEMEPGGACNWRRESFWGCRGVSPLISLIIAFPPLQSLSSFKIPILQQLELLELSSVSTFLLHFPASSFSILGDFFSSVLQITNLIIGGVLFLSPLTQLFRGTRICHFREWLLLLWLLHFHNNLLLSRQQSPERS